MNFPYFISDNEEINTAYRLAIATLSANILPFKDGILEKEEPVMIAGLGYVTPWTRDAAINTWNAGGMICPKVSLNTLKSVLTTCENGYRIDGEYWDAIIWTTGAWHQYLYTGDREFLEIAYNATVNSLAYFEETEFDSEKNLFRGPACYGDGVAAYPDIYAEPGVSGIIAFKDLKQYCCDKGVGIPDIEQARRPSYTTGGAERSGSEQARAAVGERASASVSVAVAKLWGRTLFT